MVYQTKATVAFLNIIVELSSFTLMFPRTHPS